MGSAATFGAARKAAEPSSNIVTDWTFMQCTGQPTWPSASSGLTYKCLAHPWGGSPKDRDAPTASTGPQMPVVARTGADGLGLLPPHGQGCDGQAGQEDQRARTRDAVASI